MKKVSLFEIFKIFFIIGTQLLGGGYVILPLLKKHIADERHWMSEEELVDFFALSQCIPGIIAGNISMFAGYKVRGCLGAIAAITGIIAPSFLSIIILANILINVLDNVIVQNAFWGIRIAVVILIIMTIRDMWAKSVNSRFTYLLYSFILLLLLILPVSPTLVIILSALISFLYGKIRGNNNA